MTKNVAGKVRTPPFVWKPGKGEGTRKAEILGVPRRTEAVEGGGSTLGSVAPTRIDQKGCSRPLSEGQAKTRPDRSRSIGESRS